METDYPTANDWYKSHRRELKKYRGEWIAYTNKGVISHDRDYDKMKSGIAPSLSSLDYVIERIFESEFVEPIRFYPVRMRTLKAHDWQPKYELMGAITPNKQVELSQEKPFWNQCCTGESD